MSNPIVLGFVPGTIASILEQQVDGVTTETWPAFMEDPILNADMAGPLEHDTDANATDIVLSVHLATETLPVYGSLIDYLSSNFPSMVIAGPGSLPADAPEQLFYKLPYDWRQNNNASAQDVSDMLDALDTGPFKGQPYDLYLIAHSNGGLVSRYLIEAMKPTGKTWFNNLKGLATLATPHLGAPLAWKPITGQKLFKDEFQSGVTFVSDVVNNNAFPSTAQLLPPKGDNFIDGADIYKPDSTLVKNLQTCGVSIANLNAAVTFQQDLNLAAAHIPYAFFYGTDLDTMADVNNKFAYSYHPDGQDGASIFTPEDKTGNGAGDGVVPAESGSYQGAPDSIVTKGFSGFTHDNMGGSDMVNKPDSIIAALQFCGITVPNTDQASKAAE